MKISVPIAVLLLFSLASCTGETGYLTVFHAPVFSPVMDELRDDCEKLLDTDLHFETAGSQVCCRKVTELGRECDLLMVADSSLLKGIASTHCSWRLDFGHDSVVLGIGSRAKRTDDAEQDWVSVLLDGNIRLGRVDENLGPIGYRTLLVLALKEKQGNPGLLSALKQKTAKLADHVGHLATFLKAGDIDYGFLYRTTCLKYDIRFIELDEAINLGSSENDYSGVEVSFRKLQAGEESIVKVKGDVITYGLTIPRNAANREKAVELVRCLLEEKKGVFESKGISVFRPRFYGSKADFELFSDFTEYAGGF